MNRRKRYKLRKKIICLDFDGVIHDHLLTWKGIDIIEGMPTQDAKETITQLKDTYTIIVYSGRCKEQRGVDAISEWLGKHEIDVDEVSNCKPLADYYVDDKAIRFNGDWDGMIHDIENAVHWQSLAKKSRAKRKKHGKDNW